MNSSSLTYSAQLAHLDDLHREAASRRRLAPPARPERRRVRTRYRDAIGLLAAAVLDITFARTS
jgi:hypothetical protein